MAAQGGEHRGTVAGAGQRKGPEVGPTPWEALQGASASQVKVS